MPPQRNIGFLALPRELRDEIYTLAFAPTRLRYGRYYHQASFKRVRTKPHALALLYLNRQIHAEVEDMWMRLVTFVFYDTPTLLAKLTLLSDEKVSQIRHIWLPDDHHQWHTIKSEDQCARAPNDLLLTDALCLVPQLRLDTVTLFGRNHYMLAYETILGLVRHGTQWRTLRFVYASQILLAHMMNVSRFPGRTDWDVIFRRRNDLDPGSSLRVFESTATERGNILLEKYQRELNEAEMWEIEEQVDTQGIGSHGPKHKEIMIEIKRGKNRDISPNLSITFESPWPPPGGARQELRKLYDGGRYQLESVRIYGPDGQPVEDGFEDCPQLEGDEYEDYDQFEWTFKCLDIGPNQL